MPNISFVSLESSISIRK